MDTLLVISRVNIQWNDSVYWAEYLQYSYTDLKQYKKNVVCFYIMFFLMQAVLYCFTSAVFFIVFIPQRCWTVHSDWCWIIFYNSRFGRSAGCKTNQSLYINALVLVCYRFYSNGEFRHAPHYSLYTYCTCHKHCRQSLTTLLITWLENFWIPSEYYHKDSVIKCLNKHW